MAEEKALGAVEIDALGSDTVAGGKVLRRDAVKLSRRNLFIALAIPTGAGEEIRTLDPNLGKVALWPSAHVGIDPLSSG